MERNWGPICIAVLVLGTCALAGARWLDERPEVPRFMIRRNGGMLVAPLDDAQLDAELRLAWADGATLKQCRAIVEGKADSRGRVLDGVEEAAWFPSSTRTLLFGILSIWLVCLMEAAPGGKRPRASGGARNVVTVVLVTLGAAILAAAFVWLRGAMLGRDTAVGDLVAVGAMSALWVGGMTAAMLPQGLLQRYVLRAALKALLPALVSLLLMMVVGFCMQLLDSGLDIVRLPRMLLPILAYSIPMVLPAAFLTAVVITYGRLARNNELTAVRASGVSPFQVMRPLLAVALGLSGLAVFFQFETVPGAYLRTQSLKDSAVRGVLLERISRNVHKRISFGTGFITYERSTGSRLYGVLVVLFEDGVPDTVVTAGSAVLSPTVGGDDLLVSLEGAIARFNLRDRPEAGHAKLRRAEVPLVIKSLKVDTQDEKYLRTQALRRELRMLAEQLPPDERLSDDPEEEFDDLREQILAHDRQRSTVSEDLTDLESDRDVALNRAERQAELSVIALQKAGVAERTIGELITQSGEIQGKIDAARADANDDEVRKLQRKADALRVQIGEQTKLRTAQQEEARKCQLSKAQAEEAARLYALDVATKQDELTLVEKALTVKWARASEIKAQRDMTSALLRVHRRLAWALSILGFALVGVPIGVMFSGRSVLVAFGLSFGIVLFVFYAPLSVGVPLAQAGKLPVVPTVWAGNFLTFALGVILMIKANRK